MVLETLACSVSSFSWQRIKLFCLFFFSSKTQSPYFSASVQRAKILALLPTACVALEPTQPPQALGAGHFCPAQIWL